MCSGVYFLGVLAWMYILVYVMFIGARLDPRGYPTVVDFVKFVKKRNLEAA